ncbi:hypothetical protein FNH05_18140 [Amycolatopsis rhizosphaerae]|uniref:YbaB/EbfC family nucleoid-associated protein n=1 Tax=Amycolatopsis rhizosphaerae TaxID=2053003 RepID=A0A558CH76_9PSEU|nr:hypothetical protein [Amycolatopsis rhizosphaerae]TVT48121.1 hypothetical protein FNH05_18140 [Amycolatopsis rhizosphaerae]
MDTDERSIDELIEIAEEIPDRLGLSAGMAALRGTARGEGISVAVDVQGMLVDLEIGDEALALGPERLAAEISRLSTEAGTKVLRDGLRAVKAGCVPAIAEAVEGFLDIEEEPEKSTVEEPAKSTVEELSPAPRRARPAADDEDEEEGFVLRRV